METGLRWLFRAVTFLFAVGGIGCIFVLVLTFVDDVKMLFEKPNRTEVASYTQDAPPGGAVRLKEQHS